MFKSILLILALGRVFAAGQQSCPGYHASNVRSTDSGLTADLSLAGPACNIYGTDLPNLTLTVEYQTTNRLHVLIQDQNKTVYQVPNDIAPRPNASGNASASNSNLQFKYTESPFSFAVVRSNGSTLFNTSGSPLIFESQYLYLRTSLPSNPNLYGLGEHSDSLRLHTSNYTRTLWNRDAYGIAPGTNLYGTHPTYVDHRGENGTHAVILLNSNGIDVKINDTAGQYLEYNTIGGVFDFYFLAGPTPIKTSRQISQVVGTPANIPYGGLGFHQCRYGYRDVYEVAGVVYNYSRNNIPLETMWTDIDYMQNRWIFTVDPDRFPLPKMRELISYLHAHQQKYVVMVDPAVSYQPNASYATFDDGVKQDIFLKANGSIYKGVVWPGVTAFPDWFNPNTQAYWNQQFNSFFNASTGVDIDYLWIDMNEASNFCDWPCSNPEQYAINNTLPPAPPPVRDYSPIVLPGFPSDFQPQNASSKSKRQTSSAGSMKGLPGRNLIDPAYQIHNAAGNLPNKTIRTDLVHFNGLVEYDTHNLFGTMMSNHSTNAMMSRRPGERTLVITRSTFLGAGKYVGHWLGDNLSDWPHYRISIAQMLAFSSMFQIPMVGSDVCGFGDNTTETLCARWMMLGAFYPFYRNHNQYGSIDQEAYRWPSVAAATRYAIDIRYRMLDYFYTSFYEQTMDGTPSLNPLFYLYPHDGQTFAIDLQYFYGNAVLVSPVTQENSTSVTIYLPNDIFYDWNNGFSPVRGMGASVTLDNVGFQQIPIHIRGGTILPLRMKSANTTTELRKQNFDIVIAPGLDGTANGTVYLDDGITLHTTSQTYIHFMWDGQTLSMNGTYGYDAGNNISRISLLGMDSQPPKITYAGGSMMSRYNSSSRVVSIDAQIPLNKDASMSIGSTKVYQGDASRFPTSILLVAMVPFVLFMIAA